MVERERDRETGRGKEDLCHPKVTIDRLLINIIWDIVHCFAVELVSSMKREEGRPTFIFVLFVFLAEASTK